MAMEGGRDAATRILGETQSPQLIIMPSNYKRCCVPGCESRTRAISGLSFHRFPYKTEPKMVLMIDNEKVKCKRRTLWIRNLKMLREPSKTTLVCSLHFTPFAFHPRAECDKDKKRRLKRNAVPQIEQPPKTPRATRLEQREEKKSGNRVENRLLKEDTFQRYYSDGLEMLVKAIGERHDTDDEDEISLAIVSLEKENTQDTDEQSGMSIAFGSIEKKTIQSRDEAVIRFDSDSFKTKKVDKEVQVDTSDFVTKVDQEVQVDTSYTVVQATKEVQVKLDLIATRSLVDEIASPKRLRGFTGLDSFQLLDKLTEDLDINFPGKRSKRTKTIERIICTLIRLKHDLNISLLTFLFPKISDATMTRIFEETLTHLSSMLKQYIKVPTLGEIKKKFPKQFERFPKCKMVLSCTEIITEKPSTQEKRLMYFNSSKGAYSVKVMIGVTPQGVINFVSKCYAGRTSDTQIFYQSKVIDLILPGEAIMVDKKLRINAFCKEKGVQVIQPPLRGNTPLTRQEIKLTKDIAVAKGHVEWVNKTLKQFKFLTNLLQTSKFKYVDMAVIVICALINLNKSYSPEVFPHPCTKSEDYDVTEDNCVVIDNSCDVIDDNSVVIDNSCDVTEDNSVVIDNCVDMKDNCVVIDTSYDNCLVVDDNSCDVIDDNTKPCINSDICNVLINEL